MENEEQINPVTPQQVLSFMEKAQEMIAGMLAARAEAVEAHTKRMEEFDMALKKLGYKKQRQPRKPKDPNAPAKKRSKK